MGLRDVGATLPPGFRFYPSDEELVCHYLHKKIANEEVLKGTLVEIDLHTCEPWHLPEVAKLNSSEWYFFSFRDRKYATGYRTNRATTCGYWKATGKDRIIRDPKTRAVVGMRKTLVFYRNRAPNGIKSGWIMHEFRLENPHMPPKEDWVLCRVFHKGATKGNVLENIPQNVLENSTTATATSPYIPTHDHPFPSDHHQCTTAAAAVTPPQQNPNPNPSSHCGCSLSNPTSVPHQPSEMENTAVCYVNSKCEDDYGFLFDMGFEGSGLGDGVVASPNFGEMRFDNEDDDNGSLIFI